MNLQMENKFIIWLNTAFIGDLVLMSAAVSLASKFFPDHKHIIITNKACAQIYQNMGNNFQVIIWDKEKEKIISSIIRIKKILHALGVNKANSNLLLVHKSFRSALLAFALGLPITGYRQGSMSFFYQHRVERVTVLHEAHRIALLLEPLGIKRENLLAAKPYLPIFAENSLSPWQNELATSTKKIGVAPGSIWGTKQWPIAKYSELVIAFLDKGFTPVLLGGPMEIELASKIKEDKRVAGRKIIDLIGKTKLSELGYVFKNITLLVANDSSLLHFASAYDCSCVAVFGATSKALGFGPLATRCEVVEIKDLPCKPCSLHGPKKCPLEHFKCMHDISVQMVMEACERVQT